jgi:uncharacterized protein (DUF1499 family)
MLSGGCSGTRPSLVGNGHGELAPCPETPNCVSTHATDPEHRIAPLTYEGSMDRAMQRLVGVIESMERTEIIARTEDYLYVEFTSAFWRFVDDVEFSFDHDKKVIHFRSASRLGKSDLGVNRERMERIRARFRDSGG